MYSLFRVVLKRKPAQSHCPRPHNYKLDSVNIDLSQFINVINIRTIDEELRTHKNVVIPSNFKKYIGNNYGGIYSPPSSSLTNLPMYSLRSNWCR